MNSYLFKPKRESTDAVFYLCLTASFIFLDCLIEFWMYGYEPLLFRYVFLIPLLGGFMISLTCEMLKLPIPGRFLRQVILTTSFLVFLDGVLQITQLVVNHRAILRVAILTIAIVWEARHRYTKATITIPSRLKEIRLP